MTAPDVALAVSAVQMSVARRLLEQVTVPWLVLHSSYVCPRVLQEVRQKSQLQPVAQVEEPLEVREDSQTLPIGAAHRAASSQTEWHHLEVRGHLHLHLLQAMSHHMNSTAMQPMEKAICHRCH